MWLWSWATDIGSMTRCLRLPRQGPLLVRYVSGFDPPGLPSHQTHKLLVIIPQGLLQTHPDGRWKNTGMSLTRERWGARLCSFSPRLYLQNQTICVYLQGPSVWYAGTLTNITLICDRLSKCSLDISPSSPFPWLITLTGNWKHCFVVNVSGYA